MTHHTTLQILKARRERAFETFTASPSDAALSAYTRAHEAVEMVKAANERDWRAFLVRMAGALKAGAVAGKTVL
jgi:hypothetical protein